MIQVVAAAVTDTRITTQHIKMCFYLCTDYAMQAETVFLTASRAYGMYDIEYHVMAMD